MELGIDDQTIRKIKPFLIPIGTTLAVIILTVFAIRFFWNNISDIRRDLSASNKEKNILEERLGILRKNQVELQESQDIVTTALPIRSASVMVLNQILNISRDFDELSISELEISEKVNKNADINNIQIEFILTGSYDEVSNFIARLQSSSPLVNLEEVEFDNSDPNALEASISYVSFFADAPESIPAITTPLEDFEDSEKAVISVIKDFVTPSLDSVSVSGQRPTTVKENPFVIDNSAN